MELLELSTKKLREENKKLYDVIITDYKYDLVIFIARGSYMIGKDLADLNECPLLEVFASRKGGTLKKFLSPVLKMIPLKIKENLRKKEFNSNYHEKNCERDIRFDENVWKKYKNVKKILLVDDSVDTGYSIKCAKEVIEKYFNKAEVRVAALNYFDKSEKIVVTNYYLYNEKMLLGPWSNDSSENKKYLQEYGDWHNNQGDNYE